MKAHSNLKKLSDLFCPQCGSDKLTAAKDENTHKFDITCQSCGDHFDPEDAAVSQKDFEQKKEENTKQKRWIKTLVSFLIMATLIIIYTEYQKLK
jgi:hypothetical protein